MRHGLVAVLLFLFAIPAPAQDPAVPAVLRERAARERKPLLTFVRPSRCDRCAWFEGTALAHPMIARRLERIVFATLPARKPALLLFDHAGVARARWEVLPPNVSSLGVLLDTVIAAAPHFEKAAALSAQGPAEGEIEAAFGYSKLGRMEEARAAMERAVANGTPATRQLGIVGRALMDLGAGRRAEASAALDDVIANAVSDDVKAAAWTTRGIVRQNAGQLAEAIQAYETALALAGADSDAGKAARSFLATLRAGLPPSAVVSIVPLHESIVTGRRTVRTVIGSTAVARLVFSLNGEKRQTADKPPFSAVLQFGNVPQPQTIRAVAYDAGGKELGASELVVNNAGETFWVRLVEPREGRVSGAVRVEAAVRSPAAHKIRRIVLSWNDAERAVLSEPPWRAEVNVPAELGVLRAVAELDDGRSAEDAVLLNASGFTGRADVPIVELPVTIRGGAVRPSDVTVLEGTTRRAVESVASGAELPLTVGMLIDTSSSMQKTLPDVQLAAIRFLETALAPADRAFLISFDSTARLLQTPTADRARLSEQISRLQPSGSTALHDATILGLLQFEGVKGRRALVVFSDGADRSSRYNNGDVEDLARRSNIPIYVIAAAPSLDQQRPWFSQTAGVTHPRSAAPPPPQAAAHPAWVIAINDLTRVAEATGGLLHRLNDLSRLDAVYRQIEADLRAQSLVVIRTDPGRSENDWRKIEVRVPGREVRAPQGYYAPW